MSCKKDRNIRKNILFYFVLLTVVGLSLLQLLVSHHLAVAGEELRQLELKANEIKKENQLLSQEIGQVGSLAKVNQMAEEKGFIKANDILHLSPQMPVAYQLSP